MVRALLGTAGASLDKHDGSWCARGVLLLRSRREAYGASDMAHELRPHGVAAISLYPGMVRTEAVLQAANQGWLDLSNSESPEYIGLVIEALSRDANLMDRSGKVHVAAALGAEYGLTDIDGKQPKALSLNSI